MRIVFIRHGEADKTFQVKGQKEDWLLHKEFLDCLGEYPDEEVRK